MIGRTAAASSLRFHSVQAKQVRCFCKPLPESKAKYFKDPFYTGNKQKVMETSAPVDIELIERTQIGSRLSRNLRAKGK